MKLNKKMSIVFLILFLFGMILSGCSSFEGVFNGKKATPETKLVYYYGGYVSDDNAIVFEEANKIIKKELNVTVDFRPIPMGEYNQKMKLIMASGENYDLTHTGGSRAPYVANSLKGAYAPLDSLLEKYGTWFKENIPQKVMEGCKVKEKIYAVPNYQVMYSQHAIAMQKDIVDKYKIDYKNIKTPDDVINIFEFVKKNEPNMIVSTSNINSELFVKSIDDYFETPIIGLPIIVDKTYKVLDKLKNPKVIEDYKRSQLLYNKKFFPSDNATNDNYKINSTGNVFASYTTIKPGGEAQLKSQFGGKDMYAIATSIPISTTYLTTATLTAINSGSKNTEIAFKFLNLLNSNKMLNNILFFGIENKHYKKVSENRIELIGKPAYQSYQWAIGNQFNAYLLPDQEDDVWEKTKKLNEEATPSFLLGFNFDQSNVSSDIALLSTIAKQYDSILASGKSNDVEGIYKTYSDKLYSAGMQKVMDEVQSQINEWIKTK